MKDPLQLTVRDVPGQYDVLMVAVDSNHDFFSSLVIEQMAKVRSFLPAMDQEEGHSG